MSNMSYCRFENTERDLRDCRDAMNEPTDGMSEHEKNARLRLFTLITKMADDIRNMTPDEMAHGNPDAVFGDMDGMVI